MALVPTYTLALYAGDDRDFKVTWKPGGVAADLTGYSALMELKLPGGLCDDPALSLVGVIASPLTGQIVFEFTAAATEALIIDCQNTCYSYDLQLTSPAAKDKTILKGVVNVEKDVTE